MKKLISIAIIVVSLVLTPCFLYYNSAEVVEIYVKNKERITTQQGQGKFLVYGKNEVFENTDSILFLKFNSATIYNQLDKGKRYKVRTAGWRIPFLSMYRNIIKIKNE